MSELRTSSTPRCDVASDCPVADADDRLTTRRLSANKLPLGQNKKRGTIDSTFAQKISSCFGASGV